MNLGWIVSCGNDGSSFEKSKNVNSEKEFNLRIMYICIVSKMEDKEVALSYADISALVYNFSVKKIDLKQTTVARNVKELKDRGLLVVENALVGKTHKNTYKLP